MLRRFIPKSSFSRNVFTLASGTATAQAIPLLVSPILTRLYTPEDFGIFAFYFSVLTILSVVATGKYEMAIIIPEKDDEADALLALSILIAGGVSLLLLVALLVLYAFEAGLGLGKQFFTLFLLPVSLLGVGMSQALYYYFNRRAQYGKLVKGRISRSFFYSLSAIVLGFARPGGFNLSFSDTIGYAANTGYLLTREVRSRIKACLKRDALEGAARKYVNFPKFLIVSGIFEKGSGQLPVFMLTNLFRSTAGAGFFSFAQRIIVTPADLIARSIADVFRQQASEIYAATHRCDRLFLSTMKRLALAGIIPFLVGYFVVEDVFALVFGDAWRIPGEYAKIMMPMFYLQFISSPLSVMFVIAQKQKYDLIMQVLLLAGVAGAFLFGHRNDSVETGIMSFTFVYCLKYIAELWLSYRFSQGK